MRRYFSGAVGVATLGLVAATPSSLAHGPVAASKSDSTFQCTNQGTVIGSGTVTTITQTRAGQTAGTVRFSADDGVVQTYRESYTVVANGGGGEYIGTIVTPGGPLYGNWLYITGTASYAPGGYLGSYTGTATDICAALGYLAG